MLVSMAVRGMLVCSASSGLCLIRLMPYARMRADVQYDANGGGQPLGQSRENRGQRVDNPRGCPQYDRVSSSHCAVLYAQEPQKTSPISTARRFCCRARAHSPVRVPKRLAHEASASRVGHSTSGAGAPATGANPMRLCQYVRKPQAAVPNMS